MIQHADPALRALQEMQIPAARPRRVAGRTLGALVHGAAEVVERSLDRRCHGRVAPGVCAGGGRVRDVGAGVVDAPGRRVRVVRDDVRGAARVVLRRRLRDLRDRRGRRVDGGRGAGGRRGERLGARAGRGEGQGCGGFGDDGAPEGCVEG